MRRLLLLLLLLPGLCFAGNVKNINNVVDSSVKTTLGVAVAGIKTMTGGDYNDSDTVSLSIDAVSQAYELGLASTHTVSHTCTGSDMVLFVNVGCVGDSASVTGVTYNGDAMTAVFDVDAANSYNASGWVLANPDTGTHDIVVTYVGDRTYKCICAVSFTGANTTTPIGTPAYSSSSSINVTAETGDIVIDSIYANATDVAAAEGQTERFDAYTKFGCSTKAGEATTNMAWTLTTQNHASGAVAIKKK
jgi:hypothetical protein